MMSTTASRRRPFSGFDAGLMRAKRPVNVVSANASTWTCTVWPPAARGQSVRARHRQLHGFSATRLQELLPRGRIRRGDEAARQRRRLSARRRARGDGDASACRAALARRRMRLHASYSCVEMTCRRRVCGPGFVGPGFGEAVASASRSPQRATGRLDCRQRLPGVDWVAEVAPPTT